MVSSPNASGHDRTPVLGAFVEGWRRVLAAPAVALGVLVATFLTALPLAIVLRESLREHLGSSLQADQAAAGWNAGWASEFAQQAQGIGRTFTYEILGFGGTLGNISRLLDRQSLNPALAGAVTFYLALWMFLSGGILDRFARARPVRAHAFFAACGVFFFRFLRLAVVAGAVYWALFRWLHPYLFDHLYGRWTRDMTSERDGLILRAGLYVVFVLALALVNIVVDFAKVRAVLEDRRSMIGALAASVRFLRRRPFRAAGLYLLNALVLLIILRLWFQAAPSAAAPAAVALLLSQIYLLLRLWAKLAFMASEVVFFQGELAHAGYTALPQVVWPESPSVEAMENLSGTRR